MNTSLPVEARELKVSVLLITYNHEKYIAQAIERALAQTVNFDYEIVVGDDCSTDKTREIVVEFQRRYPDKIRVLLPEQNLGLGGNRMFLQILQACRGQYVAFLDGDDYWTCSDKLQRQADFLDQHPECSMSFHNVTVCYEDEDRAPHPYNPVNQKEMSGVEDLLRGNFIQTCSAMIRRDVLAVIPDWLYTIEPQDWAIYLLTALQGKVGYLRDVMGAYRRHRGAIFYGLDEIQHLEKALRFYEIIKNNIDSRYAELIETEISRKYCNFVIAYDGTDNYIESANYLVKCLAARPKWMEEYVPGFGSKGAGIWEALEKKLWFYNHPVLYYPTKRIEAMANYLRSRLLDLRIFFRKLKRLAQHENIGLIIARPNPAFQDDRSGMGVTTLSWVALGSDAIEVHVGAPDGPLFTHSVPNGSATTGEWVHDGMFFYLQDVSEGRPLTYANTLDAIRIRVIKSDKAPPP